MIKREQAYFVMDEILMRVGRLTDKGFGAAVAYTPPPYNTDAVFCGVPLADVMLPTHSLSQIEAAAAWDKFAYWKLNPHSISEDEVFEGIDLHSRAFVDGEPSRMLYLLAQKNEFTLNDLIVTGEFNEFGLSPNGEVIAQYTKGRLDHDLAWLAETKLCRARDPLFISLKRHLYKDEEALNALYALKKLCNGGMVEYFAYAKVVTSTKYARDKLIKILYESDNPRFELANLFGYEATSMEQFRRIIAGFGIKKGSVHNRGSIDKLRLKLEQSGIL